jgi:hypothetical protein
MRSEKEEQRGLVLSLRWSRYMLGERCGNGGAITRRKDRIINKSQSSLTTASLAWAAD